METKLRVLVMITVIVIFGVTAINTTAGAVGTGVFVGRMIYCLIRDRKKD